MLNLFTNRVGRLPYSISFTIIACYSTLPSKSQSIVQVKNIKKSWTVDGIMPSLPWMLDLIRSSASNPMLRNNHHDWMMMDFPIIDSMVIIAADARRE